MNRTQAQIEWALRYNAYDWLAASPRDLEVLLDSVRGGQAAGERVPSWCGVDFLRGWAFYLVRADRFAGGGTLGAEFDAVMDAVRHHPAATAADRPPPAAATDLVPPTVFTTEPKRHRNSAFLATKQARWWEAHVAPVNRLVDGIR